MELRENNHKSIYMFDMISSDFDLYFKKHDNVYKLINLTYIIANISRQKIFNFTFQNYLKQISSG